MTRAPRAKQLAAAITLALTAVACAPPLLKLPSGPGTPLPPSSSSAEDALAQSVQGCVGVQTLTTEIAVNGTVQGRRVRGRLVAGVARPGSARLEAVVSFGQPLFILAANEDHTTLLLPRDNRVLQENGRSSSVLEAVAGVPADGADLREILTGCAPAFVSASGRMYGEMWQLVSGAGYEVYLHRESAATAWSLVATIRRATSGGPGWRADFADRQDGVPRSVRLMSLDERGRLGSQADLRLALSQVELNSPLEDDVFKIAVPPDAAPITLEELRRSGPFAADAR
jgi:hypothetical protein